MSKLGLVKCRACGRSIDRNTQDDWCMPSTNYFYHKQCFEEWGKKTSGDINAVANDNEWYNALLYYLRHVIKAPIDYKKLTSQWNTFLKQNKTAKGIVFSIRYYYDELKGDKTKSLGGIGIVSKIYQDSCTYWYEREARERGIVERIQKQMLEQMNQKVVVKKQSTRKSVRGKAFDLESLERCDRDCL